MAGGYKIRDCAYCGAPFRPSSGRQRYCEFHRLPKFAAERNNEAQRRHRADDVDARLQLQLPTGLPVSDVKDEKVWQRKARIAWIDDALRVARRLNKGGDLVCAAALVSWAERTAGGQVDLVGCHHLGSVTDDFEFRHFGPHVSPFGTCDLRYPEANDDKIERPRPAETPPEMSVSGTG